MSDSIDIHEEINALCTKLGIEPTNVAQININPRLVKATIFRTNKHGSKYIENGEAAQDEHTFKVTT